VQKGGRKSEYDDSPFANRTLEAYSNQTTTPCAQPANANLQLTSRSYNANNQDTGFQYDAAGNVLNDGHNQYLYDPEGRLCAVAYPNGTGGNYYEQYLYDASGARVGKTPRSRRYIPMSNRVTMALHARSKGQTEGWVFPSDSKPGHLTTVAKSFE
jgi:YD repeat-containing protein